MHCSPSPLSLHTYQLPESTPFLLIVYKWAGHFQMEIAQSIYMYIHMYTYIFLNTYMYTFIYFPLHAYVRYIIFPMQSIRSIMQTDPCPALHGNVPLKCADCLYDIISILSAQCSCILTETYDVMVAIATTCYVGTCMM